MPAIGRPDPEKQKRLGGTEASSPSDRPSDELSAVRAENEKLRALVVELSRLVLQNVADKK